MKTETKVIGGVLVVTVLIIFGALMLFKGNTSSTATGDYSKYIATDLALDPLKVSRDFNPKVTGATSTTATSTASTTMVYVTEFLDYECPACATNGEAITRDLLARYGSNIVITRKIFPIHGQPSYEVGRLVLASQTFGSEAYKKIHEEVFATQSQWAVMSKRDREEFLKKMITDAGINYDQLYAEAQKDMYKEQIDQDNQDARDLGVTATPSFIINGKTRITGGLPVDQLVPYIDNK